MTAEPSTPVTTSISDAYPPPEIAARVCKLGLAKVTTPVSSMVALAVLAGAFISLGALFYTVTMTSGKNGPALPFGLLRVAGGMTFSLGLVLVVVGGAELFTGNNLIAMAWAVGCVQTRLVVRNWIWVYLGNLLGAGGTAVLVLMAGVHLLGDGAVGETMVHIARSKIALDPLSALVRGILCNVLVCLAVWLCMGARSVTDKVLAIVFPITAFVACGFEHSVANMFFLPVGIALAAGGPDPLSIAGAVSNLLLVTIGNILGGTLLVALVYWFVYLRTDPESGS
jgi:formate transporter